MYEEIDFMGLVPLEFRAAVLLDEKEDMSAGGLYLPANVRTKEEINVEAGTLVAKNEGFWKGKPKPVPEIGDRVIFNKFKGQLIPIIIDKAKRFIRFINDEDILIIDRREKDDGE